MKDKDIRNRKRVGVIGGSRAAKKHLDQAAEVGRLIAEKGAVLVCGGLAGVMEAACRGARQAGGLTVGILPGGNPSEANAFVDVSIATGMGYTRNALVVMNADVLIAIDGEYGTLSEIAYARVQGKRVIGLDTWDIEGVARAASPEEAVKLALKGP
jgi:uncharacterized protein (TIGR00725 family)